MNYKLVPLYELGEIVSGSTPDTTNMEYWGGNISWITPADLTGHQGIFFTGDLRKITESGYKSCSTKIIPPGSILFSSRAPIGHCAVTTFPLCTNQGFKNLIPNNKLNPVYGYFALKFITPQIESLGRGATFTEVNKELFENVCIPLPPLSEQQRIAAILQKADRLRRLRRYASQLSDSYLQSVFLEIFGDPKNNPKGWEKDEIGNYIKVFSGHGFKFSEYSSSGVRLLQIANVSFQEVPWDTIAYLPSDYINKYPNLVLRPNDLVMALNRPILGDKVKFSLLSANDCPSILYQRVGKVEIDKKVSKDFFFGFMQTKYFFNELKQRLAGSDQPYINPTEFVKIIGYFPPKKIQDEYSLIAQQYKSLKRKLRESERQGEILFQSLLQRAFQGEL